MSPGARIQQITEQTRLSVPTAAAWSLAVGLVMFGAGSVLARNTILADAKTLVMESSAAQTRDVSSTYLRLDTFRQWELEDQVARTRESQKRDQQYWALLLEIRRGRR